MANNDVVGTVVFDLDGVVYIGSSPVPGAADALRHAEETGWQLLFATNNSTTTPGRVVRTLQERLGIRVEERAVVTSGQAAGSYLVSEGLASALVVGSEQLASAIIDLGISVSDDERPEAVVVGLDRDLSYGTIDKAARAIRDGARFVATNTDATFPTATGEAPGTGAIVAAIAYASGTDFVACGKPHAPMIERLRARLRSDRVVVVGDRPETDVALANAAGWRSVLTLTGVTTSLSDVRPEFSPDVVISKMEELPGVLDEWAK